MPATRKLQASALRKVFVGRGRRHGRSVNQAWLGRLASAAASSYSPGMKPDREDNEFRTAEPLSFAQVRAELLAVAMTNHPEFTLEDAEKMLQEAGF
jgi:hypothetical protein